MPRSCPTVIHIVHSLEGGGTERTLLSLLHALPHEAYRHAVVTLRKAGAQAALLPDHVACRPLALTGQVRSAGIRLARAIRSWRPTIIHARNTCCWNDALVAKIFLPRTKLVLGYHGLEHDEGFSAAQRRSIRTARLLGAHFTSVSTTGSEQLQREANVPANRITVLQNGVDRARFGPATSADRQRVRRTLGFSDQAFVVGTVGMLTPVKDQATLLRAAAQVVPQIPNLQLLLVGGGPLRAKLEEQAIALGLSARTHFAGKRDDVADLLSVMDAFVCCSTSEGMCNALLEAMATAVPVIATSVGDNPRIVRDGIDGVVVAPRDPAALANALQDLYRDPPRRQSLAHASSARARQFSFGQTVNAYARFYSAMLGEAAPPVGAGVHPVRA